MMVAEVLKRLNDEGWRLRRKKRTRTRHKLATLFTLALLVAFVAACVLSLRAQQRQYALNRALIAALVKGDDKWALALVHEGADPSTRYRATPEPSLLQSMTQFFHRSPPPPIYNPTALLIVCGVWWDNSQATRKAQNERPDDVELVQAMVARGADVNAKGIWGWTPLMWAVAFDRKRSAAVLLEHGADANAIYGVGTTPLMNAVAKGSDAPWLIRLLVEHGANVNAQDKRGRTALYCAVDFFVDQRIVTSTASARAALEALLTHGADPNLADHDNRTPLKLAQQHRKPDIVALLNQYGARDTGKRP